MRLIQEVLGQAWDGMVEELSERGNKKVFII
jgi:hypothetical protein